jgi:large subunit ribosomal protein L29
MEIKEIRLKREEELKEILSKIKEKMRQLKFDLGVGKLKNVREIRETKKLRSRILTVLNERKKEKK